MKELNFNLKITFSEKVRTDEEIETIMSNVVSAIFNEINTKGIVPDDAEYHTEILELHNSLLDKTFGLKF